MDIVEPTEAQHKQNPVHVVGQQTASHEDTDTMPDPDPDSELTIAVHIRRLAGKCFYNLGQLRTVRQIPQLVSVAAAYFWILLHSVT